MAWQDMETAPRDGTEVLLQVESRAGISGKCLVGHYMPGGHCIEDHPSIAAGWYFWNGCMFDQAAKPIKWAPLPETEPVDGCLCGGRERRFRKALEAIRDRGHAKGPGAAVCVTITTLADIAEQTLDADCHCAQEREWVGESRDSGDNLDRLMMQVYGRNDASVVSKALGGSTSPVLGDAAELIERLRDAVEDVMCHPAVTGFDKDMTGRLQELRGKGKRFPRSFAELEAKISWLNHELEIMQGMPTREELDATSPTMTALAHLARLGYTHEAKKALDCLDEFRRGLRRDKPELVNPWGC